MVGFQAAWLTNPNWNTLGAIPAPVVRFAQAAPESRVPSPDKPIVKASISTRIGLEDFKCKRYAPLHWRHDTAAP